MLAAALCGGGCGGAGQADPANPLGGRRRQAPVSLTLPLVGGGDLTMQSLRGVPVVLVIFSTWSMRAQAEAPQMVQLLEHHKARGLQMVGLAVAPPGEEVALMAETYMQVNGISFPVMLAAPNDPDLVAALGPVRLVPRTVVLDRKGEVVLDQAGQTDFAELHKVVEGLVGK